jgi:hypothetical protein
MVDATRNGYERIRAIPSASYRICIRAEKAKPGEPMRDFPNIVTRLMARQLYLD